MNTPVPFFILIAFVIGETILSGTWNETYFRYGIPLFKWRYRLKESLIKLPEPENLSEHFTSQWSDSLIFQKFSGNEIAFREKFFEWTLFRSTPVMHGFICFIPEERTLVVSGFMNYSVALFALIFLSMAGGGGTALFGPFLIIILGICYTVQARRYTRVCQYLSSKI